LKTPAFIEELSKMQIDSAKLSYEQNLISSLHEPQPQTSFPPPKTSMVLVQGLPEPKTALCTL
jgi:hypothetical protein